MAKGQKRSNREIRKPKQPKAAPAVTASGFAVLAQAPGKPARK
ncbi:MAG TPA: hypothetical protein VEA79_11160 [Phenylobacterium sp.]|nr:hypothetical protein [Phenylobacterium sp.]